jgi:cell shape-determining protein MreD
MTITQQMVVIFFLLIIKQHFFIWTFYVFGLNIDYQSLIISSFITGALWPSYISH